MEGAVNEGFLDDDRLVTCTMLSDAVVTGAHVGHSSSTSRTRCRVVVETLTDCTVGSTIDVTLSMRQHADDIPLSYTGNAASAERRRTTHDVIVGDSCASESAAAAVDSHASVCLSPATSGVTAAVSEVTDATDDCSRNAYSSSVVYTQHSSISSSENARVPVTDDVTTPQSTGSPMSLPSYCRSSPSTTTNCLPVTSPVHTSSSSFQRRRRKLCTECCLHCIVMATSLRFLLVVVVLGGAGSVAAGIALGALNMTVGHDFFTLSIVFIGKFCIISLTYLLSLCTL